MWLLRRILRISWVDKVTKRRGVKKSWDAQRNFAAYTKETDDVSWPRVSKSRFRKKGIDGKNSRKKGLWSTETGLSQSLNNWATVGTKSTADFLRTAERQEEWRRMIADACNRPGT